MRRIEFLSLAVEERRAAVKIVLAAAHYVAWERVEAIFRSLGRAESLVLAHASPAQRELPMHSPTLLRNERTLATAIVLALQVDLGEEKAERVIAFLAQRGAALDAVLLGACRPDSSPPTNERQAVV